MKKFPKAAADPNLDLDKLGEDEVLRLIIILLFISYRLLQKQTL